MFRKFGKMGLGASIGKSVPIEVLPETKPMTFEIITRPYSLGLFQGTVELYKGVFEEEEVVSEELIATQQLQAYPNYAPLIFQIPANDNYKDYFIKIKNIGTSAPYSDIKFTYDEYVLSEVGSVDRLGFDENGQPIHPSAYNKFDITGYIHYETIYKIIDREDNLITDRKYVGYYSNSNDDENKMFFFDGERINDGDYNNPGYLKNERDYVIKLPYYKSATDYNLTKVVIRKYLEPIDIEDMYWSGSYLPTEYESQMIVYAPPGYTYEVKYSENSRLDFEAPTSILIPPLEIDRQR